MTKPKEKEELMCHDCCYYKKPTCPMRLYCEAEAKNTRLEEHVLSLECRLRQRQEISIDTIGQLSDELEISRKERLALECKLNSLVRDYANLELELQDVREKLREELGIYH